MSLFSIFDIAGSSLAAQNIRLNTTASNLANAESISSSTDQTYRARQPVFGEVLAGYDKTPGVSAVRVLGVVESQAPLRQEFQPDHPLANEEGYIFKPNVNVVEEMANMISASRAYQNSIEVMNAAKQMMLRTLSLGQ
ncbi:MAG TPA: flagellar basal body rod protein FlgC [Gammaproteobacteria bacterium]|nr:flagellar basal body rod protein FlgC [Gammaproteobacteria bacterium]